MSITHQPIMVKSIIPFPQKPTIAEHTCQPTKPHRKPNKLWLGCCLPNHHSIPPQKETQLHQVTNAYHISYKSCPNYLQHASAHLSWASSPSWTAMCLRTLGVLATITFEKINLAHQRHQARNNKTRHIPDTPPPRCCLPKMFFAVICLKSNRNQMQEKRAFWADTCFGCTHSNAWSIFKIQLPLDPGVRLSTAFWDESDHELGCSS